MGAIPYRFEPGHQHHVAAGIATLAAIIFFLIHRRAVAARLEASVSSVSNPFLRLLFMRKLCIIKKQKDTPLA